MLKPFDLRSSRAHSRLLALAASDGQRHLKDLFAADPNRFEAMHVSISGVLFDWSKHRVTSDVMDGLLELAEEAGWIEAREKLFQGVPINQTEGRSVLHMALRAQPEDHFSVDDQNVMPDVMGVRKRILDYVDEIRSDGRIKDVVNIGIGGSDLGPVMVTKGLRAFADGPETHFVSNIDGAHLEAVLRKLEPATTLFVVVSKTFTTQETMANAQGAKDWLVRSLGDASVSQHFAAVSTNITAAKTFGISTDRVFGFSDWVGGRYSLWGPVGLSIACAIGRDAFEEFLDGARTIDAHFQSASPQKNIPLLMALIGLWYVEYLKFPTYAILPYAQDLERFPAYLQQADMESNGKSVGRDGLRVGHATGPVIWGESGTNGQHAFYQLLHQGTTVHPADIIAYKQPLSGYPDHHEKLLANAIAQAEALMIGKSRMEVEAEMSEAGQNAKVITEIAPHRVFEGNRPTGFFLFDVLSPRSLGMLIAMHEHRIFLQGVFWNVCSFDQWGVELGKQLANEVLSEWQGSLNNVQHDSSTRALMIRAKDIGGNL